MHQKVYLHKFISSKYTDRTTTIRRKKVQKLYTRNRFLNEIQISTFVIVNLCSCMFFGYVSYVKNKHLVPFPLAENLVW